MKETNNYHDLQDLRIGRILLLETYSTQDNHVNQANHEQI